jgi:F-type H+-transporting ATPase subunit epsilon
MEKLKVEVVTPEKVVLSGSADEVIAPGADGLFGVRPGHTPLLSIISPGVLTVREDGQSQSFFVAGGFVEAGPDRVRVLADQVEPVGSIDLAAAQKRLDESRGRLQGLSADDAQFELESASVKRETARMAAART